MIERYSRKEIKKIWDEKNKYQIWLDIEIAAAQAMEKLKIIPGIIIFNPLNAAIDVAIIGPNIQARGICKKSATIALGTEIKITNRNFFEKISFTFSKSIGIAIFLFIIRSIYP